MKKLKTIILVLSFSLTYVINAQIIVNQSWVNTTGEPDSDIFPLSDLDKINWSNSTIDFSGNLITVGNTLQNSGNTDILITKYNDVGTIAWQQTYNGQANGYDYGIALTTDLQGNVYVAGASASNNSIFDYAILKYNSQGTLQWANNWSGSSNGYNIPTAIAINDFGNLAIAGITSTPTLQTDVVTQVYNSSGTLLWTANYDAAGFNELPISVEFDGSGKVNVTSFIASDNNSWSIAKLGYNDSNGFLSSEDKEELTGISISEILSFAKDNQDNIYIAGSSNNPDNQNFEIIKLNNSYNIEWNNQFDGNELKDSAKEIAIDNENNIVVSGTSEKSNGGVDVLTIKINPAGNEIWRRTYMAPSESREAIVSKIHISQNDEIFIAGTVDGTQGKDFCVFMYDTKGDIRLEQIFNFGSNTNDIVKDLQIVNGNEIYLTGTVSEDNIEYKYLTIKYDLLRKFNDVIFESGKPHHRANEVIVKFLPQYVNTNFVDDRTKRFGDIYDVLPSNIINTINQRISEPLDRATLVKIFHRLTTHHTTSITRLGEEIPIPEFWSTFLLVFPDNSDIETLIGELEELGDYVVYAQPNHIYQKHIIPNDGFLNSNDQQSLFAGNGAAYPDANINVEPAWDFETGQNYTKVGVYDDEIFWGHPDFGDGTFAGSQVMGGWDFVDNVSIASVATPLNSHGTAVAGIIGALRDNEEGVAGIAGGGLDAQGNDNDRVQLFSLAISDNGNYLEDIAIGPAITEGAMFDPTQTPSGYGLDIMNSSWGGYFNSPTLEVAVKFAFNNQTLFVASKGNDGTDDPQVPSDISDLWVLSVGASGTNGQYKIANNGDQFIVDAGVAGWSSNFGNDVDVIAPGVTEIVTTLIEPTAPFTFVVGGVDVHPAPVGANMDYQSFNGTSAGAPHAAGVAALMHSLHHTNKGQWNNLAPEDYEFLIQQYATDIVNNVLGYNTVNVWDNRNGHGRLNASEVLERLEAPFWRVFHSGEPDNTNQTTALNQEFQLVAPIGNLAAGIYFGKRVDVTHTYLNIFSPTTQIIDSWSRLSSTTGISAASPIAQLNTWANFNFTIQDNVASVSATTTAWHITSSASGQNLDIWLPAPPAQLRTAYSLHLNDPNATSVENLNKVGEIKVFPNPSDGDFRIDYKLNNVNDANLVISDITGRRLINEILSLDEGFTELDLSNYSNGIYFCQIITDKGIITTKLIKQ